MGFNQKTNGGNMKTKLLLLIFLSVFYMPDVHAKCATCPVPSGSTCAAQGCTICADGNCYVCCDSSNSSATTLCKGTPTEDTSLTFSDDVGSGHYKRYKYSGTCLCPLRPEL